jgi:hypothetical protein
MLFSGKYFSFPEKYDISEKLFSYLGKNMIYPEKCF